MIPAIYRERSGSELAFGVLRALMMSYQLWGLDGGLQLSELSDYLHTSEHRLDGVLAYLAGEGLVSFHGGDGVVRLTNDGARDLLAHIAP